MWKFGCVLLIEKSIQKPGIYVPGLVMTNTSRTWKWPSRNSEFPMKIAWWIFPWDSLPEDIHDIPKKRGTPNSGVPGLGTCISMRGITYFGTWSHRGPSSDRRHHGFRKRRGGSRSFMTGWLGWCKHMVLKKKHITTYQTWYFWW